MSMLGSTRLFVNYGKGNSHGICHFKDLLMSSRFVCSVFFNTFTLFIVNQLIVLCVLLRDAAMANTQGYVSQNIKANVSGDGDKKQYKVRCFKISILVA